MARRLCAALAAALGSLHFACDEPCNANQTRADVRSSRGGGYVCIPNPPASADPPSPEPSSSSSAPPPAPVPMPPPQAAPASTCSSQGAGTLDVHVIARDGAPDALPPSGPPPTGAYTVVQATAFGPSALDLPIDVMRAEVKVTGARLELGAQVVSGGALQPLEAFVLTTATGLLVKVCESRAGAVSRALVPGDDGSTRAARVSWDASRAVFTLVVASAYGEVELVLVPKT